MPPSSSPPLLLSMPRFFFFFFFSSLNYHYFDLMALGFIASRIRIAPVARHHWNRYFSYFFNLLDAIFMFVFDDSFVRFGTNHTPAHTHIHTHARNPTTWQAPTMGSMSNIQLENLLKPHNTCRKTCKYCIAFRIIIITIRI